MKIFADEQSAWFEKINFVDEHDVFVGYDLGQDCCEHAGWFIAEEVTPYSYDCEKIHSAEIPDLEAYSFDKSFFQEVDSYDLDCGGMVVFKLAADGKPDLYLHLFNAHNGYYGHGFEVKHGGETVLSNVL